MWSQLTSGGDILRPVDDTDDGVTDVFTIFCAFDEVAGKIGFGVVL